MPTTSEERVDLLIEGKYFGHWSEVEITLSIDTLSSVTFSAPFEPDNPEFRETFRPFTFKPLEVLLHLEPLFTGTLVGVAPDLTPEERKVTVTGYSLPAVLGDCDSPVGTLPLEMRKVTLRDIAQRLVSPFGIGLEYLAPEGKAFDKVAVEVDDKVLPFLTELARQRGSVWTSTPSGKLLCWQSVSAGNPVVRFEEGKVPLGRVMPTFSPQDYFSEITGFAPTKRWKKGRGSSWTEKNPWLARPVPIRPMSFKLDDTDPGDAPEATRAKLGRMFGNMASYVIEDLPTWRDPQGNLWTPNTTLMLKAPSSMIYQETEFLIRDVVLRQKPDRLSADLGIVLPGAFSGEVPTQLPWND